MEDREAVEARDRAGADDPVEVLRRWERSGAVWQVLGRRDGQVTVALLTCAGGEEVQRLISADPRLLAFVGERSGSED